METTRQISNTFKDVWSYPKVTPRLFSNYDSIYYRNIRKVWIHMKVIIKCARILKNYLPCTLGQKVLEDVIWQNEGVQSGRHADRKLENKRFMDVSR